MTITVNVPDEMAAEVNGWKDGQTYTPELKQTGPGEFDMVATEAESATEDAAAGEESDAGESEGGDMGGGKMPASIAVLMKKGK